jgi:hypothetical protein
MFLDIIHRTVYISKHKVSETEFYLRLQVKPTPLGPIDRASSLSPVRRQKPLSCFYLKQKFSETEFCLRLQVEPTQLNAINRAVRDQFYRLGPSELVLPEDEDKIQSPKHCVLKYKQDGVSDKNRTMDNVQKHNICTSYAS